MTDAATAVQNGNLLELNPGDDFIFLLDVSGSMSSTDTPTGQNRFAFAKEKALAFCNEAAKIDTDGISIYRFGHQIRLSPHFFGGIPCLITSKNTCSAASTA